MVFVASCKQARYLEEVLRRLQAAPAWIAAIHGRLQQTQRMAKYYEFRKLRHGILICTDVASRGLDFPAVDWVIQMDVPESCDAYIHRVGRTARAGRGVPHAARRRVVGRALVLEREPLRPLPRAWRLG